MNFHSVWYETLLLIHIQRHYRQEV